MSQRDVAQALSEKYLWCVICGKPHNDPHHVKFRSRGGKDTVENEIPVCRECHDRVHDEELNLEIEGDQLKVIDKVTGEMYHRSLKSHVPTEQEGKVAFELHEHILSFKKNTELAFWNLGNCLRLMRDQEYYKVLGHDTFNEYLGSPEVGIQRTQAYKLVGVVEHCERLGVDPERVQQLDKDKLAVALPKARPETVDDILADCEVLSRSDIRETYGGGSGGGDKQEKSICEREFVCQHCGKTNRVKVKE